MSQKGGIGSTKETVPDGIEKFTFFYTSDSPFSQFYYSAFKGSSLFPSQKQEFGMDKVLTFQHCEQWMMFNKAILFQDEESATKIMKAKSPPECKALGRRVKNFDVHVWRQNNVAIIYEGNRLKFTQNGELLEALDKTEGTTLVEASPTDNIYGIGLSATNPNALNRSTWKGQNLLGETLTKLRENLKQAQSN